MLPASTAGIVDKTAEFVARNGDKFVGRILASNKGNVKFNFLKEQDAYHGGQPASSSRPHTPPRIARPRIARREAQGRQRDLELSL